MTILWYMSKEFSGELYCSSFEGVTQPTATTAKRIVAAKIIYLYLYTVYSILQHKWHVSLSENADYTSRKAQNKAPQLRTRTNRIMFFVEGADLIRSLR